MNQPEFVTIQSTTAMPLSLSSISTFPIFPSKSVHSKFPMLKEIIIMINNKLKSPNRSIRLLWGFASRSHWHSGFFFGLFSLHYRPSWSMNQFQSSNWVSKSESFIRCVDAGSRCVDAPFEATERLQTAAKWAVAIQRWKKNNNKMSPFLDCD